MKTSEQGGTSDGGRGKEYDSQYKHRIITESDNDKSSFSVIQTKHPQLNRTKERG